MALECVTSHLPSDKSFTSYDIYSSVVLELKLLLNFISQLEDVYVQKRYEALLFFMSVFNNLMSGVRDFLSFQIHFSFLPLMFLKHARQSEE